MDITLAGSGVTYIPDDDQLARVSLEFAAFDGEVGTGQLPIQDSAAALTVVTGRQAKVLEQGTVLTDGFVIDLDRARGPEPASTAREYAVSIMDANALLTGFRLEWNRGSETDYARVIAFAAAYLPSADTAFVLNASTATMPKKRYSSGDGASELIMDLVEFTGKTMFVHDKANGTGRCLHYHVITTGHACGLTITDANGVADGITSFKPQQPIRQRTSVDLINDVKGRDQSNRTFIAKDATSITAHDADGLRHQAIVDFEAVSQADLDAKTNAILASQKNDLDTYTCAIGPLDNNALALIRVGDIIPVTSSVMGLVGNNQRIAHMTLTPYAVGGPPSPGLWNAYLELGNPIRRRARVKAGPGLGRIIPPPPPFDPGVGCNDVTLIGAWVHDTGSSSNDTASVSDTTGSFAETANATMSSRWHKTVSPGTKPYEIHSYWVLNNVSASVGGAQVFMYINNPPGTDETYASFHVGSDTGIPIVYQWIASFRGAADIDYGAQSAGPFNVELAIRVAAGGQMSCRVACNGITDTGWVPQTGVGSNLSVVYIVARTDSAGVFPYSIGLVGFTITESSPGCAPEIGQGIVPEVVGTGNSSTVLFNTDFPYQPGTLIVWVNGIREFNVTETSPSTGGFTFASPPFTGEIIEVQYVAAGSGL